MIVIQQRSPVEAIMKIIFFLFFNNLMIFHLNFECIGVNYHYLKFPLSAVFTFWFLSEMQKGRGKQGKQSDALERINYLAQLSALAAEQGNHSLARNYNSILLQIAQKHQLRVPALVKRAICKTCLSNIDIRNEQNVSVRIQRKIFDCIVWIDFIEFRN
jgi:RNase P subunit RPR2